MLLVRRASMAGNIGKECWRSKEELVLFIKQQTPPLFTASGFALPIPPITNYNSILATAMPSIGMAGKHENASGKIEFHNWVKVRLGQIRMMCHLDGGDANRLAIRAL